MISCIFHKCAILLAGPLSSNHVIIDVPIRVLDHIVIFSNAKDKARGSSRGVAVLSMANHHLPISFVTSNRLPS
jgi:hypothetical protein